MRELLGDNDDENDGDNGDGGGGGGGGGGEVRAYGVSGRDHE